METTLMEEKKVEALKPSGLKDLIVRAPVTSAGNEWITITYNHGGHPEALDLPTSDPAFSDYDPSVITALEVELSFGDKATPHVHYKILKVFTE